MLSSALNQKFRPPDTRLPEYSERNSFPPLLATRSIMSLNGKQTLNEKVGGGKASERLDLEKKSSVEKGGPSEALGKPLQIPSQESQQIYSPSLEPCVPKQTHNPQNHRKNDQTHFKNSEVPSKEVKTQSSAHRTPGKSAIPAPPVVYQSFAARLKARQESSFTPMDFENPIYASKQGHPAVIFDKMDFISRMANRCKHTLVGKFASTMPKMEIIRSRFISQTELTGHAKIAHFNSRHVYIDFDNELDMLTVWLKQRVNIAGKVMRLQVWTPTFTPEEETPIVPVWVLIPELPWHLYYLDCLQLLLAPVGKMLFLDSASQQKTRGSMAKIKMQVNLSKKLPSHIWLGYDKDQVGDGRWLKIQYEGLIDYCLYCKHQGHLVQECSVKQGDEVMQHEEGMKKTGDSLERKRSRGGQGPDDSRGVHDTETKAKAVTGSFKGNTVNEALPQIQNENTEVKGGKGKNTASKDAHKIVNMQLKSRLPKKSRIEFVQVNDHRKMDKTGPGQNMAPASRNAVASGGTQDQVNTASKSDKKVVEGEQTVNPQVANQLRTSSKNADSKVMMTPELFNVAALKSNQQMDTGRDTVNDATVETTQEVNSCRNQYYEKKNSELQPDISKGKMQYETGCSSEVSHFISNVDDHNSSVLTDLGGVLSAATKGQKQEGGRSKESQTRAAKIRGHELENLLPIDWNPNPQEETCDSPSPWTTDEEINHVHEQGWKTVQRKKQKKTWLQSREKAWAQRREQATRMTQARHPQYKSKEKTGTNFILLDERNPKKGSKAMVIADFPQEGEFAKPIQIAFPAGYVTPMRSPRNQHKNQEDEYGVINTEDEEENLLSESEGDESEDKQVNHFIKKSGPYFHPKSYKKEQWKNYKSS